MVLQLRLQLFTQLCQWTRFNWWFSKGCACCKAIPRQNTRCSTVFVDLRDAFFVFGSRRRLFSTFLLFLEDKFVPDLSPQLHTFVDLQTDISRDVLPGIAGHLRVLVFRQWQVTQVVILSDLFFQMLFYLVHISSSKSSVVSAGIMRHETGNETPERMYLADQSQPCGLLEACVALS